MSVLSDEAAEGGFGYDKGTVVNIPANSQLKTKCPEKMKVLTADPDPLRNRLR